MGSVEGFSQTLRLWCGISKDHVTQQGNKGEQKGLDAVAHVARHGALEEKEAEHWNCSGPGKRAWESTGSSSGKTVQGNENVIFERRDSEE